MILVTGAAGKTGRAVVSALAQRGATVRAWVRRSEQAPTVRSAGASEVVVGDMADAGSLQQAVSGVRAIYLICPNMYPAESEVACAIVAAAKAARVQQLVYHSVLHPQVEAMPHHWRKARVEEAIFAAQVPFTILQPASYMQNLLPQWPQLRSTGVLASPYAPEAQLSLVDLEDVAEVAAIVLLRAGHLGASYELAGAGAKSQHEVAGILANVLGVPIRAEAAPLDEWESRARAAGHSSATVEMLKQMFAYYSAHGLAGNPHILRWLLGREPTTISAFARRSEASLRVV